MSDKLKVGDKIRVRYWNELPKITDWNLAFFHANGGKEAQILEIDEIDSFIINARLNIVLSISNKDFINIHALKKINHVPEHLFEIG